MSCKITFSTDGKINGVLDKKGQPSKLFQSIFNTPILTLAESIEAYKNVFNEEGDVVVSYDTPQGESFNTYQEALKATTEGLIQLKVNDKVIASVDSDSNIKTFNGTINHLTKNGIFTGERILDVNGNQIFSVKGETITAKQLSSNIAEDVAVRLLGASSVKRLNTGDLILTDNLNKRTINGKVVKDSEVNEMNYDQLKKEFGEDTALEIELEREITKSLKPSDVKKRIDEDTEIKSEDELITSIKNLLNSLGIKITSFEDYIKNNAIKNGDIPATSSALMDIINKVMAFRDGNITRDDLIEETMHLIEASLDPSQTEGIRKNIHKTPEWQQYSDHYYEVYSKEYSGEKLDEVVRREILGKVMANGVANNFQLSQDATLTQQSIFDRIKELLQDFFNKINMFFTDNHQAQTDALNKDIFVKLMAGELVNELNPEQNFGTKLRLYSSSNNLSNDLVQIQKQAENALLYIKNQVYTVGKKDTAQRTMLQQAEEAFGKSSKYAEKASQLQDEAERIQAERIANNEAAASFSFMTNIAQKQLKYLERTIKKNKQLSYPFSSEERITYESLVHQFGNKILPAVKTILENKGNLRTQAENKILSEVNKTIDSITHLKGQFNTQDYDAREVIINLISNRLGLNEEKKAFLRQRMESEQSDVNWFFTNFGSLMHSSNIYLNTAGHIVSRVQFEKRQGTLQDAQPFLNKLKKAGYLNTKVKDLAKDGYLLNRFNDKAREDALIQKKYELYKKYSGNDISFEDFKKKTDFTDLKEDALLNYTKDLEEWSNEEFTLGTLSSEEIKERKQRLASYSKETQEHVRNTSSQYNEIMQRAEIVDGIPTFTQEMKQDFENLKKQQTYASALEDENGDVKKGIIFRTREEWERSPKETKTLSNGETVELDTDIVKVDNNTFISLDASAEVAATKAFELTKINNGYIAEMKVENKQKDFSEDFENILSSLDNKAAYDFLMLNANISYSDEYYQSFNKVGMIDKLRNQLGGDNDFEILNLIDNIAVASRKQRAILKANRVMNNPSEVNYDNMERSTEVEQVKKYAEELESYYAQAREYLPKEEYEESDTTETLPNKAFEAYMRDSENIERLVYDEDIYDAHTKESVDKIFNVVLNHTTAKGRERINSLRGFVISFSKGDYKKLDKRYTKIFSKTEEEYREMSQEEIYASMTNDLLKYSYTRLLPYFKKTQPTGVDIALNELEAGIITPTEFFKNYKDGEYKDLKITPNYNFQKANDNIKRNPHFLLAKKNNTPLLRTFEMGVTEQDVKTKSVDQLYKEGKLNKYVSLEYLKEFDIDLAHLFETGEEVARKNVEKFEARNAFVELQQLTLDHYGVLGSHNIYLLPQKEKGRFRKLEDVFSSKDNVKKILDELINFREDEASLGQKPDGEAALKISTPSIPKFGLRKLKEGEATDELLQSYIWMNQESNLYSSRNKNIGDMLALNEALLSSTFDENLAVQSSNVYKMLEDSLKYNFYGVKETFSKEFEILGKKGNWGQVLRSFGSLIRFRNLAYNITIPITSALSSSVQQRIERVVGERVDKDGLSEGYKKFRKEAGDAARETFGLENNSWLNAIGSKYGFIDYDDKFQNSNYGKFLRGFGRSAFAAHSIGAYPINVPTGLGVLADHRFVGNSVIQFQDFKAQNKGKSEKELRNEWKNYTSVMDVSIVDENGVPTYDYDKIIEAMNTNPTLDEVKSILNEVEHNIFNRIKLAIQSVDLAISPEDKSIAARNSILSFTAIHKGWFYLSLMNRFKGRQLNTSSGRIEEGSYTSAFRVINSVFKDLKKGEAKDIVKYIKDRWINGDPVTKRNMKRIMADTVALNSLIALMVLGLKQVEGDDDEVSAALKLPTYFLMRVANETASSSTSLPNTFLGNLDNMVVGMNNLELISDLPGLWENEKATSGRFGGMTAREKYVFKFIPFMKEYLNYSQLDETIQTYKHFNFDQNKDSSKNLDWLTIYSFLEEEK